MSKGHEMGKSLEELKESSLGWSEESQVVVLRESALGSQAQTVGEKGPERTVFPGSLWFRLGQAPHLSF